VAILGCGAVTALGLGIEPLASALRSNRSGLGCRARWEGRGYQSTVCGWVSEAVMAALRSDHQTQEEARAFLLARAALRQAALELETLSRSVPSVRQGLVLSTTKADIEALERAVGGQPGSAGALRHLQPAWLAKDLAGAMDVDGPVQCVSAACISGLLAIHQAAAMIRRGEADLVYVAGVDLVSHFVLAGFSSLKSLEPNGCRPFDARRAGLSLGEGAGALALARQELAPPGSVWVRGGGASNDANHLTGPSRDGSGLALAIRRALGQAGLPADSVDYINAHGTGTPYNDAMEAHALRAVFDRNVPPFSSSKGMLGHTLGAAGVLETILCVLALREGLLPGTPRLAERDPIVPESLIVEPRLASGLRRVLKLNCGFGGTNAALLLERTEDRSPV
jgi:3-oxoacyl-(acyl-carrier-protein) synthase